MDQEELSEVLRRAQSLDIRSMTTLGASPDLDTFIRVADEIGISREAVLEALRERFGYSLEIIVPGGQVFAKSVDHAFYVVTVMDDRLAVIRTLLLSP